MKQSHKYLLSIDGGGIRGILPLVALTKLEETTGKLSREIFSFIAGTSTGALIAGGIAAGIPARGMLKLYLTLSDNVFRQSLFNPIKRFFKGYMYSTANLHKIIQQELKDAKDWTLNDVPIDILITAKDVKNGLPWYFVRDKTSNSCECGKLKLADCVTASCAAPTYFYPWNIPSIGDLVDGGIGVAGNPVYQACVEAFYYSDYDPEETTVISLGTGRFFEEKTPTWLFSWLEWILGELLSSPGEQQTELVERHFPKTEFYRLDPDLHALDPNLKKDILLDDVSLAPKLKELGEVFTKTIDWEKILNCTDDTFKVTSKKTQWFEYKWPPE